MPALDTCLTRSRGPSGEALLRLGVSLLDDYLQFLAGRCRPNTVPAAICDLRVFCTVVAIAPSEVRAADVLGFITAQRTGRVGEYSVVQSVNVEGDSAGVSASTAARPLSMISGFFAFRQVRGDVGMNPVSVGGCQPAGTGLARGRGCRDSRTRRLPRS